MSILFADGADHYRDSASGGDGVVQKWGVITRTAAPGTDAVGRNGGRALRMVGTCGVGRIVDIVGTNTIRYTVGFAWFKEVPGTLPATRQILLAFKLGGTHQFSLNYNSVEQLELRRGSESGTLVASTTALPSGFFNSYHYIEVQIVVDDNAGSIEVHIDGATTAWDVALATITNTGTNAGMTIVSLEGNNTAVTPIVDDVYILDDVDRSVDATPDATDFLGDVKVPFLGASSLVDTGNYKQFTPSTGTNHAAMVDDPVSATPCPDGDSTYVGAPTTGLRDSFLLATASGITNPIAVQIIHNSRSDGVARNLSSFTRQGGVDYDNPAQSVGVTNYDMYRDILERNPATTAPWVLAEVNPPTEWGVLS